MGETDHRSRTPETLAARWGRKWRKPPGGDPRSGAMAGRRDWHVHSRLDDPRPRTGEEPCRVIIVGGGIAGLSVAWYLERAAAARGLPLEYTLLERSERWGGKVWTERVEGFGGGPFLLEAGPDAFLTRKPAALALARELGLGARIQGINMEHARTFVVRHGRPTPLPEGVRLLAPTRWGPLLRSPLFSAAGKLRMGLEMLLPPRRDEADESLASFVRRRYGSEALDVLAEPLMAGVYNGEPERQSILATFPQFRALEARYGSVTRGARAEARAETQARARAAGADGEQPGTAVPPFISFDTGTATLVEALLARLTGTLRLSTSAAGIERDGSGYRVTLADGDGAGSGMEGASAGSGVEGSRVQGGMALTADAVIVAALAPDAAALLRSVAPEAAERLGAIRTAGIASVYLAYPRDAVTHSLDGFGVVIPSGEGRRIDGMTWTSSKWSGRAPDGSVLLRLFFGGPATRGMLDLPDDDVVAAARAEAADLLGARGDPLFHRIYRWRDGYPQYDVGHRERVAAIEAALPSGLVVTGSSYRGVGVPDTVAQGQAAAERIVASLAGNANAQ